MASLVICPETVPSGFVLVTIVGALIVYNLNVLNQLLIFEVLGLGVEKVKGRWRLGEEVEVEPRLVLFS